MYRCIILICYNNGKPDLLHSLIDDPMLFSIAMEGASITIIYEFFTVTIFLSCKGVNKLVM